MILQSMFLFLLGAQAAQSAPSDAAATHPAAAIESEPPTESPADTPGTRAARCLAELERLQHAAKPDPQVVASVLKEGLAAADELAEQKIDAEEETTPPPRARALKEMANRTRECQIAILRGELHRAAAAALPAEHPQRGEWTKQAITIFRTLRVEYRVVPVSLMGYIGESKVQRLTGDLKAAGQALVPALRTPQRLGDTAMAELLRIARLESLEVRLREEPVGAEIEAQQWLRSSEWKEDTVWPARIKWVLARAWTARYAARQAGSTRPADDDARMLLTEIVNLLRDSGVAAVAPRYERLEMLIGLGAGLSDKPITAGELAAWAGVLWEAGREEEALLSYEKAAAGTGPSLDPDGLYTYAILLRKAGRYVQAADGCDRLLAQASVDHPRRAAALQLRALVLLDAMAAQTEPAAALRDRAVAALRAIVESELPIALRQDALRQFLALQEDGDLGAALVYLDAHAELVTDDPYLMQARAVADWQRLSRQITAGAPSEPQTNEQMRHVREQIDAALSAARAAGNEEMIASCVLARARLLAGPPLSDTRGALQALEQDSELFESQSRVSREATHLRLELLLKLGLLEQALTLLNAIPEPASGPAGPGQLQLAELLVQQYAGAAQNRNKVREHVLNLCQQSLTGSVTGGEDYTGTVRRAARCLLAVGAAADARRILEGIQSDAALRKNPQVRLDCMLMLADCYQQEGRPEEALRRLETLAAAFPREPEIHLARGRCLAALRLPDKAAASYREARKLSTAGSPEWCRATLALAENLRTGGQASAAREVLRVSLALYPDFGSPELLSELKRMQNPTTR